MRFRAAPLVVLAALAIASGASATTPQKLAVLGFQSDFSPARLIDENAKAMTLVGVDGVRFTGYGNLSEPTEGAARQYARATATGLPAMLLVSNWSNKLKRFSEPLAYQTLSDKQYNEIAVEGLVLDVIAHGWDGVSVDLESLQRRDAAGLTRFVSELRRELPSDLITVCVQAATSKRGYAAMGYQLRLLANSANQIVLMSYDYHGPWEKTPGPIGPLRWQRATVAALKTGVDATKILLGVANYGYAWRPHSRETLTVAQARSLAKRLHATPHWSAKAGEWTAKANGTTIWWSDKRSIKVRLALARKLGLHGIAVWSLGTGDRLPLLP